MSHVNVKEWQCPLSVPYRPYRLISHVGNVICIMITVYMYSMRSSFIHFSGHGIIQFVSYIGSVPLK